MTAAIRLVTLDVTNTLITVRGGAGGAYKHVAKQFGYNHLEDTPADLIQSNFKKSFQQQWQKAPNFGHGEMPAKEWWNVVTMDTMTLLANQMGPSEISDFSEVLYDSFSTAALYQILPGAKETVKELASRLDVIVITNNDSRVRNILLELFGDDLFDDILISYEQGVYKPDTQLFTRALERKGVKASETLHVGDSYENDYFPASSLGMRSLLLTSNRREPPAHCTTIESVSEILQHI